jgi:hypothetical protein
MVSVLVSTFGNGAYKLAMAKFNANSRLPFCFPVILGTLTDVICQPQGEDFRHIGNQKFQHVMKDYSYIFQKATSDEDRIEIAAKLVKIWRSLEPIGRFLIRQKDSTIKKWYDAGDEEAVTWTTHKLEESNDIHHDECRDDNTASTACSSSNHSSGQQQQHRTSFGSTKRQNEQVHGVSDCFGGFFRSAFLSLFAIEQKDGGILQQYLP